MLFCPSLLQQNYDNSTEEEEETTPTYGTPTSTTPTSATPTPAPPTSATPTSAPPTSVTPTMCTMIGSSEDQFVYMYEVWLGLYYVQVDLAQKKKCLQR